MNEERRLANEKGYESPIHETIQDTHNNYNSNFQYILQNAKSTDRIFIASHNVETVKIAKQIVNEKQSQAKVTFGQLKGFSD